MPNEGWYYKIIENTMQKKPQHLFKGQFLYLCMGVVRKPMKIPVTADRQKTAKNGPIPDEI